MFRFANHLKISYIIFKMIHNSISKNSKCNVMLSKFTFKKPKVTSISPLIPKLKLNLNHHFTKFYNFTNKQYLNKQIYSNILCVPMGFTTLTSNNIVHDISISILAIITTLSFQEILSFIAKKNILKRTETRKILHIISAPTFCVFWIFYSNSPANRYIALSLPLLNCVKLILTRLKIIKDPSFVKSITREGKLNEIIKGPLFYCIVVGFGCLLWRENALSLLIIGTMAGGDGFADIIGRNFGKHKIPYNVDKSWEGSIAMFFGSFTVSFLLIWLYQHYNFFNFDMTDAIYAICTTSFMAALIESFPNYIFYDDNISVPIATFIFGSLSLNYFL